MNINSFKSTVFFTVAAVIILTSCQKSCASLPKKDLQEVRVRLNWTVYGEHAPFFIAKAKGYYENEGLDVQIAEGNGSGTTVQLIANETDHFGVAGAGSVASSISNGTPIKSVSVLSAKNPMAVIFKKDRPLKTFKDLEGRRIGITAGDATGQMFPALLAAAKLDSSKVIQVLLPTARTKEEALIQDRVDAFVGFYIDQPPRLKAETGIDFAWLRYQNVGIDSLSSCLITTTKMMREKPELVRRFVRATQLGRKFMEDDKKAAAEILKTAPSEPIKPELALYLIELALEISPLALHAGKPIGWTSPEEWVNTLTLLQKYSGFNGQINPELYYTNDFLADTK